MSGQRFSHELSELPAQMAEAGIVLRRKWGKNPTRSFLSCVRCGRNKAESMDLCEECGGRRPGWRQYRPDQQGDPPYYGENWVPLDQITVRKVG